MKRKGEEIEWGNADSPDSPDSPGERSTRREQPYPDRDLSVPVPSASLRISEVRLRFPPDQSGPVVAYASCLINGCLSLNDIRIERGRQSGLVIVYPSRASTSGKRHFTFNPVTRDAGETLRQALLRGLQMFGDSRGEGDAGHGGVR